MTRLSVEQLLHRAGRGSSEPWVARASDQARYVVKFRGAGPGPEALAAELVVNALAVRWGYPVPEARPVWLDADTPRAGTDEFWDVLDASVGWNLAVRWVPDARDVSLAPPPDFAPAVLDAIAVIDRLFVNYDRTTLNGNVIADAADAHWLIDHGSCRFFSRLGDDAPTFDLPINHYLRDSDDADDADDADRRAVPPPTDAAALGAALAAVPQEWLDAIGISRDALVNGLARRIAAFIRVRAAR